ncbi:MAG: hypothetical protein AB1546_14370 [bacterium]
MRDELILQDEYMAGSTWWTMGYLLPNEGEEKKNIADVLSMCYPLYTSGDLISFSFNVDTKIFQMTFDENSSAKGKTIIYVPADRHYTNGFTVESTDSNGRWSWEWDEENNLVKLAADRSVNRHTITIKPKI